jgi:hypothetical protein
MAISFIGGTPPGRGDGTLEKHSEGVTFRRPSIRDGLNVSDCRPLLVALIASIPAAAQAPPRAPKPYAPVAITRPAASDDASFVAFRAALAAKAKPRIYAELAPPVLAQGFFLGPRLQSGLRSAQARGGQPCRRDRARAGQGAGWGTLAAFAAEATVEQRPEPDGLPDISPGGTKTEPLKKIGWIEPSRPQQRLILT